jgi:hypothetical protein
MEFPSWLDTTKRHAPLAFPFLLAVLVIVVSILYWRRTRNSKNSWVDDLKSSKSSASKDTGPLKDIWQERRRNGTAATSSSSRSEKKGDRPFGSSYYYAHNNPNAKGGYTDGLRMEDYTMNGPRLLSKSGVPVVSNESNADTNIGQEEVTPEETVVDEKPLEARKPVPKENTRPITKYLWDDPGDPNGIATIRIETLPAASDGSPVRWSEMNQKIVDIDAKLVNNKKGLLVILETGDGEKYKLYIATLYGDVDAVRTLVKPKRLLVRLYKKKNRINIWDKSNLKEWPHPYADRDKQA